MGIGREIENILCGYKFDRIVDIRYIIVMRCVRTVNIVVMIIVNSE